MLLDRARQHVAEEDPGLIEAHGHVSRHLVRAALGLVALHHLGRELAEARLQGLGVEELRRDGIDVVDVVHVVLEGLRQLVKLAVAGTMADQRRPFQPGLLGLAQE
jgi:hypothetical protein